MRRYRAMSFSVSSPTASLVIAVLTLASCSSNNAAVGPDKCTTVKCSRDPATTAEQAVSCRAALDDKLCGTRYAAAIECMQAHPFCDAFGKGAPMSVRAACDEQIVSFETCSMSPITAPAVTPDAGSTTGAGASAACVSACQKARNASCSSVKDCASFCSAAYTVSVAGNCTSEREAYETCAGSGDACGTDTRCSTQKSAFGSCASKYCSSHATEASCKTLME